MEKQLTLIMTDWFPVDTNIAACSLPSGSGEWVAAGRAFAGPFAGVYDLIEVRARGPSLGRYYWAHSNAMKVVSVPRAPWLVTMEDLNL